MTRLPDPDALYYESHIFCCTNQRDADHPRGSCKARGGEELRDYMKARAKELGLKGRARVNSAGCLDRCELGPCLVIYPEGIWYTVQTRADVDEILNRHVLGGEVVDRLVLPKDQVEPKAVHLKLKVEAVTDLTDTIKRFELVSADDAPLPTFDAGAHITVKTGDAGTRSYSLCNDPSETGRYAIAVQRETAGKGGSAWMCDTVGAGTVLEATPPVNDFKLHADARRHILIAGGIGITPLLAMVRQLDRDGVDYALHYCARGPEAAAFLDELQDRFGAHLTLHFDGGDPAKGIDLDKALGTYTEGTHIYICGPLGLMDAVKEKADAKGWPNGGVHSEYFAAKPTRRINAPFVVELAKSNKRLTVPADKSILEVLRENGIEAESSCESGVCGTCRTRLLSGVADHRDMVLSDEEKSENTDAMICVSRAGEGEVLVLDL